MKRSKTRICGARVAGDVCKRNPGHAGAHIGLVAVWGDPKSPARRRLRAPSGQTALVFGRVAQGGRPWKG